MIKRARESLRLRLRDRSTGDLLVMLIASTITFVLVVVAIATIIFVFLNPGGPPVDNAVRLVTDMMNTLVGLLAGFMVGRTRTVVSTGDVRHEAASDNASAYVNVSDSELPGLEVYHGSGSAPPAEPEQTGLPLDPNDPQNQRPKEGT